MLYTYVFVCVLFHKDENSRLADKLTMTYNPPLVIVSIIAYHSNLSYLEADRCSIVGMPHTHAAHPPP